MRRHQGGDHVNAGFYLNLDSWEVTTISGKDGATLDGGASTRYLRMPVLAMLLFAPLMGAVFAMFLPFIGIAMVAQYAAVKTWQGAGQAAHSMVTALGPAWQPSAAHLTGTPDQEKKADAAAQETDAKLDSLEREIDGQADRQPASRR